MWTNMSSIYLNITQVEELDSGLYFCGYYTDGRPVTTAISLNIKGKSCLSSHWLVVYFSAVCFQTTSYMSQVFFLIILN